jgi:signal transduction histidine kinase
MRGAQSDDGKAGRGCLPPRIRLTCMNQFFDVSAPGREALLGRLDLTTPQNRELNTSPLEDLVHELRQPLGVIESIAYFLEITAENDQLRGHMQRIQAMVLQANRILEQTSGGGAEKALSAAAC